jgi:predicted AlkP superfamily phosphohydrolase/phosphomutase
MRRVLAIFLDGYEHSLAQQLMAAGEMPALARLGAESASFLLDYGSAQRTGLAGEHVATGLSPEAARRWAAVHFDPETYTAWQEGTRLRPFAADLGCRTVVFDAPYFNLSAAPTVQGVVSWGAHDPGVPATARPPDLAAEIDARFGRYPAHRWIYGFAWPSEEKSRAMGADLARAVDVRTSAARWLLGERCPDWDLAVVAVSEPHSVIEGLWHGIDPMHPLRGLPSAASAGKGVRTVYQAVDRLIGELRAAFPDAAVLVFAMGGMGVNRADLPSMLFLPELLYRRAFGAPFFRQPREWSLSHESFPLLPPGTESWEGRIAAQFPVTPRFKARRLAARMLPPSVKRLLRRALASRKHPASSERISLDWMPASSYRRFWHGMPAFALPSYYDGRVRLNVRGRERDGIVEAADYRRVLTEVENLVRGSIDPATGEHAVDHVEHHARSDPRELAPTQADLVVIWKGTPACLDHPTLGRIGPVPYRRTGGHTGDSGFAYVLDGRGKQGADGGIRSSFDVVPTIIELLGLPNNPSLSGTSLLSDPATAGGQTGALGAEPKAETEGQVLASAARR